jgi:hypothetical protein
MPVHEDSILARFARAALVEWSGGASGLYTKETKETKNFVMRPRAVRLTFPSLPWHTVPNHYSAQPSMAEAGLAPASRSKDEGCT